jgi:hypothetical protein
MAWNKKWLAGIGVVGALVAGGVYTKVSAPEVPVETLVEAEPVAVETTDATQYIPSEPVPEETAPEVKPEHTIIETITAAKKSLAEKITKNFRKKAATPKRVVSANRSVAPRPQTPRYVTFDSYRYRIDHGIIPEGNNANYHRIK